MVISFCEFTVVIPLRTVDRTCNRPAELFSLLVESKKLKRKTSLHRQAL